MLTYLLTIAASGLLGLGGGAVGGFLMANRESTRVHRRIDGMSNSFQDMEFVVSHNKEQVSKANGYIETLYKEQQAAGQAFGQRLENLEQNVSTREELRAAFMQLVTRQELELALQSVVSVIGQAPQLATPRMPAPMVQTAAENQAELAKVLNSLTAQMNGINQQLGIGG